MNRSAGLSVWPKKNQWNQLAANLASQRSRASAMGIPSIRHSRRTEPGESSARRCAT
jgi:hypothetical protein